MDLYVTASVRTLADAILGRRDLLQAISDGLVGVDGPRHLARGLPAWIGASPYAQPPEPFPVGTHS